MFKYDGKEYRNLTEQVNKNQYDILRLLEGDATLAQFGLKVVNISTTPPMVKPEPIEGDANVFGYAWLVGAQVPYLMFVWTRTEQNLDGEWVNIGEFPKAGPQGIQGEVGATGPQGETGARGTRGSWWTFGDLFPNQALLGDLHMRPNFDLYNYTNGSWQYIGNIKGAKGDQGLQGNDGATPQIVDGYWYINGQSTGIKAEGADGTSVNIQTGIYTEGSLPSFAQTQTNDAYIVQDSEGKYDLYIHGYGGVNWTIVDDWGGVPGPEGPSGEKGASITDVEVVPAGVDNQGGNIYNMEVTIEGKQEPVFAGDFIAPTGRAALVYKESIPVVSTGFSLQVDTDYSGPGIFINHTSGTGLATSTEPVYRWLLTWTPDGVQILSTATNDRYLKFNTQTPYFRMYLINQAETYFPKIYVPKDVGNQRLWMEATEEDVKTSNLTQSLIIYDHMAFDSSLPANKINSSPNYVDVSKFWNGTGYVMTQVDGESISKYLWEFDGGGSAYIQVPTSNFNRAPVQGEVFSAPYESDGVAYLGTYQVVIVGTSLTQVLPIRSIRLTGGIGPAGTKGATGDKGNPVCVYTGTLSSNGDVNNVGTDIHTYIEGNFSIPYQNLKIGDLVMWTYEYDGQTWVTPVKSIEWDKGGAAAVYLYSRPNGVKVSGPGGKDALQLSATVSSGTTISVSSAKFNRVPEVNDTFYAMYLSGTTTYMGLYQVMLISGTTVQATRLATNSITGPSGNPGAPGADGKSISVFKFGGSTNGISAMNFDVSSWIYDSSGSNISNVSYWRASVSTASTLATLQATFTFNNNLVVSSSKNISFMGTGQITRGGTTQTCCRMTKVELINTSGVATTIMTHTTSTVPSQFEPIAGEATIPAGTYNKIRISAGSVGATSIGESFYASIGLMLYYLLD